jgi:hypothetical protein
MAYMSQEKKAKLAPRIKAHCRKYGIKASIAVRHHSTLVVNIKSGPLDFCQNTFDRCADEYNRRFPHCAPMKKPDAIQVNVYWVDSHFTGKCQKFLSELLSIMNDGNHDRSDIMTDYFDVGWYNDINVGSWNKPYQVIK